MPRWRRSPDGAGTLVTEQRQRNQGRTAQRLASIGHHFLSDSSAIPQPADPARVVNVTIADLRHDRFPTLALAATVARLGVECHVHEHGQVDIRLRPAPKAVENLQPHIRKSRLHIYLSDSADVVGDTSVDTLLFAISACDKGVRDGFMRLKYYLSIMRPDRIGLTLMDCPNIEQARHFFAVMKQACRDFLATGVYSYGALGTGRAPTNTELAGIARLLLSDHELCEPPPRHIIGVDNKAIGTPV